MAGQQPFVWCERIEDETGAVIDRKALRAGEDFLAEVLRTADWLKENPDSFRGRLADLYEHARHRRYLDAFRDEDIAALLDEAESMAVGLLVDEDDCCGSGTFISTVLGGSWTVTSPPSSA